jgi:hypothetical protein
LFFERVLYSYATQAGLELEILLLQLLEWWDHRHAPPHSGLFIYLIDEKNMTEVRQPSQGK